MRHDKERYEPALVEIKQSNAAALKVYLTDGTERAVAITKAKNKWSKLATTLDALPWDRIECLDAKGAVIHVVDAEDDGYQDDSDDISDVSDAKLAKVIAGVVKFTMTECRKMFQVQIDGFSKVIEAQAEATQSLQQTYEMQARVQMAAQAAEASGGSSEVMEMMKMAMMMSMGQKQASRPMQAPARPPARPRQMPLPSVPNKPPTEHSKPVGEGHP